MIYDLRFLIEKDNDNDQDYDFQNHHIKFDFYAIGYIMYIE